MNHHQLFESHTHLAAVTVSMVGAWKGRKAGIERDDMYQAALQELWRSCKSFRVDGGASFKTYALGNMILSVRSLIASSRYGVDSKARRERGIDHSAFREVPGSLVSKENTLSSAQKSELIESVQKAINSLPNEEREIINLINAGGTLATISRDIGWSKQTINRRRNRAFGSLREQLAYLVSPGG